MKSAKEYFEEILNIPRESGKEEKIAQYLINYAKENNIEYHLGKYNTIFLRKNNHSNKTIILQAHSDMVCVSTNNYDFDNKGIPFYIDGDYYRAKNTSLGADDGIGVAIILAILQESENMPNIEVMITTQEETTMLGAMNFDYSLVTGKTLISLDGIKEADIESASAGMCSITLNKKINYCDGKDKVYKLSMRGLMGGHSGDDIDKNRCNAIKLIIKSLDSIGSKKIVGIDIGKRNNVIPSDGYAIFSSEYDIDTIKSKINVLDLNLNKDDMNFEYDIELLENNRYIKESENIINLLNDLKDGLLETYSDDKFPLLSANIGRISNEDKLVTIKYSIRSSDKLKETELINETKDIANKYGFELVIDSVKPFFPYKEKSNIRDLLAISYKDLYGKDTTIKKIHAFVFIVNKNNNISDLSIEQIKDIYTGKIVNWEQVGGENKPVIALQRSEGSGSQTAMLSFMNGTEMKKSTQSVIGRKIGYSFRYYVESIVNDGNIKMLSINGVEPNIENIRNNKYPIVDNFYMIYRKDNTNENIEKIKEFVLSEKGQKIIEDTGYVSVKGY